MSSANDSSKYTIGFFRENVVAVYQAIARWSGVDDELIYIVQEGCEIGLTRVDGLGSIRQVARKIGRIAQLEERCPYKAEVTGSIPVPPTSRRFWVTRNMSNL